MSAPRPPHPLSSPEAYLASRRFSQRLPRCPRSGLPASFADMGDPDGTPVLWVLPSGCSRWVAVPQDPLARLYGIRLIVIDRPGCGATPEVPLGDRIRISGQMTASVLEHLDVKPAHLIVNSAGIYYAFDLLLNHPHIFPTALSPPPPVYMISPWSPLLPSSHPDYYPSYFTWIPTPLIATQHITLPQLAKLAENSSNLWTSSSKAFWSGLSAAKGLLDGLASPASAASRRGSGSASGSRTPQTTTTPTATSHVAGAGFDAAAHDKPLPLPRDTLGEVASVPRRAAPMVVQGVAYRDGDPDEDELEHEHLVLEDDADGDVEVKGNGLWGRFPCCVSCTTTEYMQAESFSGIGQEHLICLNRGPTDTGPAFLEQATDELAARLGGTDAGAGAGHALDVRIWWGWEDTMVPRKGQLWFNRNIQRYPERIRVELRDVEDGDHTDLLGRAEGIYEVYALIRKRAQGRSGADDEQE